MEIADPGHGLPQVPQAEAETRQAADELGLDCNIEKVTELADIMTYGVMMTPALVVDGEVKVVGKVPARGGAQEAAQPEAAAPEDS